MKNTYYHLSIEERDRIGVLRAQGTSITEIARTLGRDKGTISRELQRNRAPIYNVYLPHKADLRAKERKRRAGKRLRLRNTMIRRYVINHLRKGWSPEQITGRLSHDRPGYSISHEAIYQFVYDRVTRQRMNLVSCLPRAHRKRKRFGQGHHHTSLHIPNRVSIDRRPKYINQRIQAGHWEADTMISRQSKQALLVGLERSSRKVHINKLVAKHSRLVVRKLSHRLKQYPPQLRRTITYDNGSENVGHEKLNAILGTRSYFCNPFHSWEKGSIEHAIGLIRRFLPKKTDFAIITPTQVQTIERRLNNRPRKCLGYKTPSEVFSKSVALPG